MSLASGRDLCRWCGSLLVLSGPVRGPPSFKVSVSLAPGQMVSVCTSPSPRRPLPWCFARISELSCGPRLGKACSRCPGLFTSSKMEWRRRALWRWRNRGWHGLPLVPRLWALLARDCMKQMSIRWVKEFLICRTGWWIWNCVLHPSECALVVWSPEMLETRRWFGTFNSDQDPHSDPLRVGNANRAK